MTSGGEAGGVAGGVGGAAGCAPATAGTIKPARHASENKFLLMTCPQPAAEMQRGHAMHAPAPDLRENAGSWRSRTLNPNGQIRRHDPPYRADDYGVSQ
jgi:hypothetical protein